MVSVTESEIDLFADDLLSMDQIRALSESVNSSEKSQMDFDEQLEANMSRTGRKAALAQGLGLFVLGRYAEAAKKLGKGKDCKEKFLCRAFALRRIGEFDQAIESLKESLNYGAEKLEVALEKACTYRHAADFKAAAKALKACANFENVSAEYHYQLGRLNEAQGLYEQAIDSYRTALELAP
ncbi:MAG: tetratricopeptide repeat protein, partial [Planctomycetota bacterium]